MKKDKNSKNTRRRSLSAVLTESNGYNSSFKGALSWSIGGR